MRAEIPLDAAATDKGAGPLRSGRAALGLLTVASLAVAGAAAARAPMTHLDPDLVRVIRFMAAIKGGLALAAWIACFWRLARPAGPWRTATYVVGPPAMAGASIALGALVSPALAAAFLHLGLLAVVAAALTDRDFIPDLPWRGRRGGRRGGSASGGPGRLGARTR
ncbi:hypothetical protein MKK88_14660 [Methylobacterium sp. E-005]|uniref:hypothetical protein n=1 Tax=Methylobacterium sp. E-005 TaxID=2836549 RepID=UPI001FB8DB34|nr:hypothetical protein [Methylobacterium sp. E-005]MCJ2087217.1 hypothetical protein [Methylobacterium sp. E-005]